MEPPTCFAPDSVRSEKTKLLDAIHSFGSRDALRNVVRGQYGAGIVGGKSVATYL
jgi:glucose-6-phosphate 1-dehydrogenase